jgi:carboxymethylenebutenolidase
VVYPDAPHSFFDRRATEFASASEDAWRQMLEFMGVG